VLVDPEGFTHDPFDPVTRRLRPDVTPGGKPYLYGARASHIGGRHRPVADDERSCTHNPDILPPPVEERPDEAPTFEATGAREGVPASVGPVGVVWALGPGQRRELTCPTWSR
jgi:hypothetical protein